MYKCPHCGGDSITFWEKLCLGPAIPSKCRLCGRQVGVPFYSVVYAPLPFVLAILFIGYFETLPAKIFVLVIGVFLMGLVHVKFVPLVKK